MNTRAGQLPNLVSAIGFSIETILIVLICVVFTIVAVLLVLFFKKRSSSTTTRKNESLDPPPKKKVKRENRRDKRESGEAYPEIISDLRNKYPKAENIALKDIKIDGSNLVGTFHVKGKDTLLEHRKLMYEFVSSREIHAEEQEEKTSLSELIDQDHAEFYLDEYGTTYLWTPHTFKKLSSTDTERKDVISQAKGWISFNSGAAREDLTIKSIYHQEGLFTILLDEKDSPRDHHLVVEKKGVVKEYKRIDSQDPLWREKELESLIDLPFTHGIEIELQVVKEDWHWMDGDQMAIVFEEILSRAKKKISRLRSKADKTIQAKWTRDVIIKKDDKGYEAVHVAYGPDRKFYSVLGKDSHVALKTNILEIQTPPCEYLEELEWWIYNLYRISYEVVEELEIGATLLSVGTNPVEEYSRGVSFGEHHHIGIEERKMRNRVHNTYRYLTPHLISISSTTPFLGEEKPRMTFNDMGNLVILEPSYSMRLKKNREQFQVPPYLPEGVGKEHMEQELGMTQKSLRMIDIFPFTRFDTVEVRVLDTQVTTMDRISMAILLQALALYVKEEFQEDDQGPFVSDAVLEKNREISIDEGLMGLFYTPSEKEHPLTEGTSKRYIHESWKNVFQKIYPYLERMDVERSIYMKNIFLRLFEMEDCSHDLPLKPPIAPSQLLLYRGYRSDDLDFDDILQELKYLSTKAALDKRYNLWSEYVDLEEIELSDIRGLSPRTVDE